MRRRTFVGLLGVSPLLPWGCGGRTSDLPSSAPSPGPEPFLGFPEDRVRRMEDENPESALRGLGVITMTEVQTTDYATYRQYKERGAIIKEERRGGEVLFATEDSLHVPIGEGGDGAYVLVTRRYKATLPVGP